MFKDKLYLKNYKCFDQEGVCFDGFKNINILIGKNNSGKSSVIDLVKFLSTGDKSFFESQRNNNPPEIICKHIFKKELIGNSFPTDSRIFMGSNYVYINKYGLDFDDSIMTYRIDETNSVVFEVMDKTIHSETHIYFQQYLNKLDNSFRGKKISHISAERDILPEDSVSKLDISTTGIGATNFIQGIINLNHFNSDLVEIKLLYELNLILKPDIEFSRISVQLNSDTNKWEIYFTNQIDGKVPLSKMGSGVKTILLVLLLLIVKPYIESQKPQDYIFAFEELENNLHPSLQRRLYRYLIDFSNTNNCVFFFTTHSNIVIDLFNNLEESKIFHIQKNNQKTIVKTVENHNSIKHILNDLEVKASDILQSNGIIWVEGPSDRIYLNKWISLLDNNLIEGNHYSIMFYGGRLLSNLTFNYENLEKELIPLLKLNSNAFVVMDRDGKTISTKLNVTKNRIEDEIGVNKTWITFGREIENYLTDNSLNMWLEATYQVKNSTVVFDKNEKLETSLNGLKNAPLYNKNKNKYAKEIVEFLGIDDLNFRDLNSKVNLVIENIKNWNKL